MTVVQFKKTRGKTYAVACDQKTNRVSCTQKHSEQEWRLLITNGIRDKMRTGTKIKRIVEETGLSHGTISRLIYGETRFPRLETIVVLMKYLGYSLFAVKD